METLINGSFQIFCRGVCIHQALADMTLAHLTLAVQAEVCPTVEGVLV